jgi:hypothetical protein
MGAFCGGISVARLPSVGFGGRRGGVAARVRCFQPRVAVMSRRRARRIDRPRSEVPSGANDEQMPVVP